MENGTKKREIKLPDEEIIDYKKNGKTYKICTMRRKVLYTIGLNDRPYHRPYTRQGKKFFRPKRNFLYCDKSGDKDLETLYEAGYMEKSTVNFSTDTEYVIYKFNRAGLDWLGEQLGIHIWDK